VRVEHFAYIDCLESRVAFGPQASSAVRRRRASEGLFHSLPRFAGKLRAVHCGEARSALYKRLDLARRCFSCSNLAARRLRVNNPSVSTRLFRGIAESCLQKRAKARPVNEFGRQRCAMDGHTVV
jgi:hypothetical protein